MSASISKTETAAVERPATNGYNPADFIHSRYALELAAKGISLVSPNPLVGCVIVSASGEIVGEGFYTYDGVTHAEVMALEQAGERARGGTAYVSLEPHSHQGKTAPCTDALIDAGIRRVVAPIEDPNPLVSGRGFQRLRDAGVEVTTGILANEATILNEKFICWHKNKRPFVHLKLAMSVDGRISLNNSISTALTSDEARARVQNLRHEYDAILVGANTATVDDPMLTDRSGKPRRRPLVRIVLDDRLRISSNSKLANTDVAPTIVFTKTSDKTCASELTSRGVDIIESEAGSRDLDAILRCLAEREIQSVLVEGGSQVAGAFVDAGLVDKITLIAAPLIIGGSEAPVAIGGRGAQTFAEALRFQDLSIDRLGNDIEITGYPSRAGVDNV